MQPSHRQEFLASIADRVTILESSQRLPFPICCYQTRANEASRLVDAP